MRVTLQGLASPSTAPRLSSSSASSEPPALSPVVEFDGSFDDVSDHMDHKEHDARTHHQQDIPVGWEAQLDIDPIQHLFSPSFASDFTSWLAVAHAVDNCNPSGSDQSSADDSSDSGSEQDHSDSDEPTLSDSQDLLADFNAALQPLYQGCRVSLLAKLIVMFKAAARHKASKAYMQSQFLQCAWTLPTPNIFPTYTAAVSLLRRLSGIAIVQYDSCMG